MPCDAARESSAMRCPLSAKVGHTLESSIVHSGHGHHRVTAAGSARSRKLVAEAAGGRSPARQAHAARGNPKRVVKPIQKQPIVPLINTHNFAETSSVLKKPAARLAIGLCLGDCWLCESVLYSGSVGCWRVKERRCPMTTQATLFDCVVVSLRSGAGVPTDRSANLAFRDLPDRLARH